MFWTTSATSRLTYRSHNRRLPMKLDVTLVTHHELKSEEVEGRTKSSPIGPALQLEGGS